MSHSRSWLKTKTLTEPINNKKHSSDVYQYASKLLKFNKHDERRHKVNMDLMRKKPATNVARRRYGGVRGAAFSAVQTADIKCASRWNTSAFGEQPSGPHHLSFHGYLHCCLVSIYCFGIVTNAVTHMITYLF
jgi:hypothetical protein